jgi:hypothetical protein
LQEFSRKDETMSEVKKGADLGLFVLLF